MLDTIDLQDNFILDLAASHLLASPERCLVLAPLPAELRALGGTAALGVLLTLADIGACEPALVACAPDWTATQDMSLHGADWLQLGPAVLDCRLLRVGRKVVVVGVDVYDGAGELDLHLLAKRVDAGDLPRAGRGIVTFARLPRSAARAQDADGFRPAEWVGQVRHRTGGRRSQQSLAERTGLRVIDAELGILEQELTPYVANSIGTVNGGVQAVLAQLAAEAVCPGRTAVDAQLHFLAQLRVGPVRTEASVLRSSFDHDVVDVRLVDAGADDHLLTLATVTLRTTNR